MTTPTSEGGRLRVQDLRTPGDPTGLDGSLIRIDPRTGAGAPGNPLSGSGDENERRILAYGMRDPMRLAIRPGTNDVWVGDRGGGYFEEFDRVPDTSRVRNFGWPCYEGAMDANGDPYTRIRPRSVEEGAQICLDLYALGNADGPGVLVLRPRAERRARRAVREERRGRPAGRAAVRHVTSTRPRAGTSRLRTGRRCSSATGSGTASSPCCRAPTDCPSAAT